MIAYCVNYEGTDKTVDIDSVDPQRIRTILLIREAFGTELITARERSIKQTIDYEQQFTRMHTCILCKHFGRDATISYHVFIISARTATLFLSYIIDQSTGKDGSNFPECH